MRPKNTKTVEFGTNNGLLQGCERRWMIRALRTPKLLKALTKPFSRKGEGGAW